jgi:hypothetical protein
MEEGAWIILKCPEIHSIFKLCIVYKDLAIIIECSEPGCSSFVQSCTNLRYQGHLKYLNPNSPD